jgi:hypothetical protein
MTLSQVGTATTTLTGTGTRIVSFLSGKGVGYIAGPAMGQTTELVMNELGTHYLTPAVEKSTQVTAAVTAAAAGAAAMLMTTAIIYGGEYVYNNLIRRLPNQKSEKIAAGYTVRDDGEFGIVDLHSEVLPDVEPKSI